MKIITQTIYTEGPNSESLGLNAALKQFHAHTPIKNGVDWELQYFWAILTDEDCLLFCLQHPEFADKFKAV